jgi:hypothetical protein
MSKEYISGDFTIDLEDQEWQVEYEVEFYYSPATWGSRGGSPEESGEEVDILSMKNAAGIDASEEFIEKYYEDLSRIAIERAREKGDAMAEMEPPDQDRMELNEEKEAINKIALNEWKDITINFEDMEKRVAELGDYKVNEWVANPENEAISKNKIEAGKIKYKDLDVEYEVEVGEDYSIENVKIISIEDEDGNAIKGLPIGWLRAAKAEIYKDIEAGNTTAKEYAEPDYDDEYHGEDKGHIEGENTDEAQ